jgi:hypothetical protein
MKSIRSSARFIGAATVLALVCVLLIALRISAAPHHRAVSAQLYTAAALSDKANSVAAFESIVPILRHPRCINCHSTGDFPRQGDDSHPHAMNVRRGPDGHGITAEKCSTCHQDHNLGEEHLPPGAPNWHLPPADMPMIWQGLTDRQICEQLKDPPRNGHRSLADIEEHMATDKLVAWGWDPGPGRDPVPMPKPEFAAKVKTWISGGAACPTK